jgi:integrase
MWIETTKTGLRLCDRYKGLDGKLHKVSVSLPKDTPQARRKASEELQKKIMDKSSIECEMRFFALVELYLKHKDVKQTTMANYIAAFKQIKIILEDVPVDQITAPYIKRRMAGSGKPASTLNRYIMLLNNLLSWSYEYGYIGSLIRISPLKEKKAKKGPEEEYLEASELKEVLEQLEGTMHYYICKFMSLTGCRVGEAIALTLSDIDNKYIHITKAWHIDQGLSTPKTESSIRDIYIQPELHSFLSEYKKWRLEYMMAYKIRTDLLFFSRNATYMNASYLRIKLNEIDFPKHLHPHIFRHTHTALLAEQGMSLDAIARRLGHADSTITKKIYFHVTKKIKESDEKALDNINIL